MSKQGDPLELEKCIVSRLWYTAATIVLDRCDTGDRSKPQRDVKNLTDLIGSCAEQGLHEHRWIAYNLLSQLDNNEEARRLLKQEEFFNTLKLLDTRIPDRTKEELLTLFKSVQGAGENSDVAACQLSRESLERLESIILKIPTVVHWIIDGLLCIWLPTQFAQSDSSLQDVYFNAVRSFIQLDGEIAENEQSAFLGSKRKSYHVEKERLGVLWSILSKINLTDSKEDELLAWLYPALVNRCKSDDVELALYSRKNIKFFKSWHNFLDDTYARNSVADSLENALRIGRILFELNEDTTTSLNANEIFRRSLKREAHWIMDILDVCCMLLLNERYRDVEKILENPLLKDFWLFLLLKLLNDCPIDTIYTPEDFQTSQSLCETLKFVLKKSEDNSPDDPTLRRLRATLRNHLELLNYILRHKSSPSPSNNQKSTTNYSNFTVKQALHLLRSHSVLSVLKLTTNLHESDHDETVSFLHDSDNSQSIFRAYRAMLSALKAILLSQSYNSHHQKVAEHFDDMERLLGGLFPLDLRLEVIENIFSMLFLRHEDFLDSDSGSDGGSDESPEKTKIKSPTTKSRSGFVCNFYATRETLHRLKCSATSIEFEFAEQNKIPETFETVKKRSSAISKSLADATWRLELLTNSEFLENRGTPDSFSYSKFSGDSSTPPDARLNCSLGNSGTTFYRPSESSEEENELPRSDLDGSSEATSTSGGGGGGGGASGAGRRRKRLRKSSSIVEPGSATRETIKRERALNLMLASKESLVVQCLWKGDYDRAAQVTEMFGLKNSHLEGEILFSRAMRTFRRDVRTHLGNSEIVDTPDFAKTQSTLENIRRAVSDGFHASRSTSQVETFLAAQESHVRLLSSDSTTAKEILTMASLDLALTMSASRQISLNLGGVATKYLQSCKRFSTTPCHNFFQNIYQALYESDDPQLSIKQILCDAKIPLSVKSAKEKINHWFRLQDRLQAFRKNIEDNNSDRQLEENTKNQSESVLEDLTTICDNGELYLPRVNAHLKLLRGILPEESSEAEASDFCLLKTSPDAYIGDQLFRLDLEIEEVEALASRLRVNLVHSVLVNCCPRLLVHEEKSLKIGQNWASTILNRFGSKISISAANEPNLCVTEILTELLQVLNVEIHPRASFGPAEARELSKNSEIRRILRKTEKLAFLDLSNLSSGDHTLVFFVNVWNLMFLHASLDVWSAEPPIDDLRHEMSLTTICYEIGDLGKVSLQSLRFRLLGHSFFKKLYFPREEELNEAAWQDLDVPQEPRVVFALINEFVDSPALRIYAPKTLDSELSVSAADYLHFYREKREKGSPPELISRYNDLKARKMNFPRSDFLDDERVGETGSKKFNDRLEYAYSVTIFYSEPGPPSLEKKISEEENFCWRSRNVKQSLLQFLEGHCWLLSYLVQRIHEESPTILESGCEPAGRTAVLENLLKSSWNRNLKFLCEDNQTVAGLRKISLSGDLWSILEDLVAAGEVTRCLELVNSLPDILLRSSVEIQLLKDLLLASLIANSNSDTAVSFVYQIRDERVLAGLVLSTTGNLSSCNSREILEHALSHGNKEKLPRHCETKMREALRMLEVFEKIRPHCQEASEDVSSWREAIDGTEKANPVKIVKSLIEANKFELCLEWLEFQSVSAEIQSLVTQELLVGLLSNEQENFKHANKLLRALPTKKAIKLCNGVFGRLEAIGAMKFVGEYLLEKARGAEIEKYRRTIVGIEILERLEAKERRAYVNLIERPQLMLEQLLMNCRLDCLQKILEDFREKGRGEDWERFDETVRFYAKKSLDFRVAFQGETEKGKEMTNSGGKGQSGDFVMPTNVPSKEEWVPNDKARECSCCRVVIFTMFNRRHHCRRCGRVVCANCSPQRMRLPSYPNSVPVRVCNDCKRQMLLPLQAASTPSSSEAFEYWRLTIDEAHNKTLREEFSFENAPNISLCLAILNLHSDHEAYSNFLFDRCDDMMRLLRPDTQGRVNPEVDHGLIIRMIRSFLLAAKVKCAELGLNTGLTHCDRFLSQVDLIATLVNADCSALIPRTDKDDHLGDHTLRRLRDLLTEKELWTVALDVSTKIGIDTQGVWAAWGTACLKAGFYERARDKFVHCLDRVLRDDSEDWVLLSYPGETSADHEKRFPEPRDFFPESRSKKTANSKPHEGLKSRPTKDPPLLTEILQILEKTSPSDCYTHQNSKTRANNPHEILNTLNSLKFVSQGQYLAPQVNNARNFRYQESLYYLLMYGSCGSILDFFVRHEELDKCLAFVLENDIEPELFVNVFLRCLRNGKAIELCEAMRARDSSLIVFRKYLMHTCHCLERKGLLNTLHQLQLFMKDYIRAAMTCIRFYVTEAASYEDLGGRTHFLEEAQRHLEAELQLESFGRKRRKSVSSSASGGQHGLALEMEPAEIDRHINTISRQMEIAKFLGNREREGHSVSGIVNKLAYMDSESLAVRNVPTLFGNQMEKTHLAVLAILCGRDVEEGFGIAFRIMQDYNLRQQKIYSLVGHMLALDRNINSIEQLIKCCRSSGAPNSNAISDRVLAHCVKLLLDRSRTDSNPSPKDQIDSLIRIITDVELKIDSYIESRQLKAAYLLAVKHSRAQDIRKILKEADRLGQLAIKSICTKWLQQTQGS